MSSSCSTILSFGYLDSVISMQSCNSRFVLLPIKSIVRNALSHEKGKEVFKNHGDRIFLLSPSWSIFKHNIYKTYLAKLMNNRECWLVDTGGAALQVDCSFSCRCVCVHLSLPISKVVSLALQIPASPVLGVWSCRVEGCCLVEISALSPGMGAGSILLGEVTTAWHSALLKLLWATRQAHQMSSAWLQMNHSWCAGQDKILCISVMGLGCLHAREEKEVAHLSERQGYKLSEHLLQLFHLLCSYKLEKFCVSSLLKLLGRCRSNNPRNTRCTVPAWVIIVFLLILRSEQDSGVICLYWEHLC